MSFASYSRPFVRWALQHRLTEDCSFPLPDRAEERLASEEEEEEAARQELAVQLRLLLSELEALGEGAALHRAFLTSLLEGGGEELFFSTVGLDPSEWREELLLGLCKALHSELCSCLEGKGTEPPNL